MAEAEPSIQTNVWMVPGQGATFEGMGLIAGDDPHALWTFEQATNFLRDNGLTFNGKNIDLVKLCFDTPNEILSSETVYTQLAVFVTSIAAERRLSKLVEENTKPDILMGHSLGEYVALVVSGVLTFEEALNLVYHRATYMSEAVKAGPPGGMAVVMGWDGDDPESIRDLEEWSNDRGVQLANINSPRQLIISGSKTLLDAAGGELGRQYRPLTNVAGAFHSSLMNSARNKLRRHIEETGYEFQDPLIRLILNSTGHYADETEVQVAETNQKIILPAGAFIGHQAPDQVTSKVLWWPGIKLAAGRAEAQEEPEEDRRYMFVEVGAGKLLTDMIGKSIAAKNVLVVPVSEAFDRRSLQWSDLAA